jgi:hypothetical protein
MPPVGRPKGRVQVRSSDSKLAALQEAYDAGHPEVALRILGGSVRVYTRSPKSKPGWQVSDYRNPYPEGTEFVVLVDSYRTGRPEGFYVVPVADVEQILADQFRSVFPDGVRPVSPDATHSVVTVDSVSQYRDAWSAAE